MNADANGGGGTFSGIDPQLMNDMISSIKSGSDALQGVGGSLKRDCIWLGVASAQLQEIIDIGKWAAEQLPMLRRRQQLAQALDSSPNQSGNLVLLSEPVLTPEEARRKGEEAAKEIKEAYEEYQKDPNNVHKRRALLDAIAKTRGYEHDPDFAAGMMQSLGGETVAKIVDLWVSPSPDDPNANPLYRTELPAPDLETLKKELGPLATMFATADRVGLLPQQVRDDFLAATKDKVYDYAAAVFLRLSDHTDEFAMQVGKVLLRHGAVSPEMVRAKHMLIEELADRPHAMRVILADEDCVKNLFDNNLWERDTSHGIREDLARALDPALADPDENLTQKAWANIIKVTGEDSGRQLIGTSPEVAGVLAKRIQPYFAYLAYLQGKDLTNSEKPMDVPPGSTLPGVTTEQAANFFGGLLVDAGARETMLVAARDAMKKSDALQMITPEALANGTPITETTEFQHRQAQELGLAALLLHSTMVADFDEVAKREFVNAVVGIPFGYGTMPLGVGGPLADAALTSVKNSAGKKVADFLIEDNAEPDKLEKGLQEAYTTVLDERLKTASEGLKIPTERIDGVRASALNGYESITENAEDALAERKKK